jgi:signal transduction histidine kinase
MAEMVSPNHPRNTAAVDSTFPQEHGGERARMTEFRQDAVIQEFRLLRKVIIEVLNENKVPYDQVSTNLIHAFIDECIQASTTAFSLVQATLREHVIATLTHDMRNPLTVATLATDTIIRKSQDPEIIKHAQKIKRSHRSIDGLIHDLLNTTLLKAGGRLNLKFEKCSVRDLLNEIVEDLPADQVSRIKCISEDIEGVWDKGHLKRALENLITNAFKYGDPSSEVTIKVTNVLQRTIFAIHNFGLPIAKEEIEAIFQIFRRAEAANDGKKPGWGLGLPIVRAVAESHGGSISVDSLKEEGTTFILDIPQDSSPYTDVLISE